MQVQSHIRIETFEDRKRAGQQIGGTHGGNSDFQQTDISLDNVIDFMVKLALFIQDLCGVFNIAFSDIGWYVFVSDPLEQRLSYITFHILKKPGKRRLSQIDRLGRFCYISIFCYRQNITHIFEIHSSQSPILLYHPGTEKIMMPGSRGHTLIPANMSGTGSFDLK